MENKLIGGGEVSDVVETDLLKYESGDLQENSVSALQNSRLGLRNRHRAQS